MRIGAIIDSDKPLDRIVGEVGGFADAGLASAWCTQTFGYDALTLLAVVGGAVPGIELGTAVVPVHPRHPQMLAQQAVTVHDAIGGRLTLGIGLSHAMVVEGMWGLRYDRPARYMREYLSILVPLLAGEKVSVHGEVLTANTMAPITQADGEPVPVVVAALGSTMLTLAGRMAAGTVTWMTGLRTVAEHIVPTIAGAADAAGRPAPRVVVSLPVTVTDEPQEARRRIDEVFAFYPSLPSYRAMLDREGAQQPSDIALVGSEEEVRAGLDAAATAGTTDFVASFVCRSEERRRTIALLAGYPG